MRFLIDENLPADLAPGLVTTGHDVRAIAEQRILVARDLDFPLPKALGRPPGLVVMRPRWNARGAEVRHLFADFLSKVDLSSLEGAVTIVEPGRFRQRRYDDLPW